MFTKSTHQEVENVVVLHWLLMCACAGLLNTVAFIGLGTFATHVTGFSTLFGVHTAQFRIGHAIAALAVPLFFLAGAIISGLCVEARVRRRKAPHYDYVMYVCCFLMALACLIGNMRDYDLEQSYLHLKKNFILLSLICMSSGLINAALSYSSRSTVRITHLTGITTDLGRGIAECIALRARGIEITKTDLRLNLLRALTIGAFTLGSVVGAVLFQSVYFNALLVPAIYFLYVGKHARKTKVATQEA